LIDSAELRLPMTEVSAGLAARLDLEFERRMEVSSKIAELTDAVSRTDR
jgi:4-hydroxy-tetrahydrodipicolinate synthase